jgi:hypothetical protein
MTRRLSKRQKALLEISQAFGTPEDRRNKKQLRLTEHGICFGMCELRAHHSDCDNEIVYALNADINQAMLCSYRYNPTWTPANDLWRCDLASFLAAMTDEEYNWTFEVEDD